MTNDNDKTTTPPSAADLLGTGAHPAAHAWRRWRWPLVGALVLGVAGLAAWQVWREPAPVVWRYATTAVSRGALVVKVTATGNLAPTNQVTVGSELSGTIEKVFVDVNDRVKRGQALAQLDTTKLREQMAQSDAQGQQARANLSTAQAAVREARAALQRLQEVKQLSGGKVPAATELDSAQATLDKAIATEALQRATIAQVEAAQRVDRTNLAKATIRAAVDGVVLARSVDPGQTVAASLQAPTLFTLAESLQQMKLEVAVDEADVGQVKDGQRATFTVDAYAERRYPATILRVNYGSTTTNNVVSYKTILMLDNADLTLRPGMTATAEIVTLERQNALLVPSAALRWQPRQDGGAGTPARSSVVSSLIPRPPGGNGRPKTATTTVKAGGQQTLWVLGADQKPRAVPVTVGASDGRNTEITAGELKAGDAVITDATQGQP